MWFVNRADRGLVLSLGACGHQLRAHTWLYRNIPTILGRRSMERPKVLTFPGLLKTSSKVARYPLATFKLIPTSFQPLMLKTTEVLSTHSRDILKRAGIRTRCSHHYDGCHAWDNKDVLLEHIFGIRILCIGSGEMALLLFLRTQVQFPAPSSGTLRHCTQVVHRHTRRQKTQHFFFLM